MFPAYIQPTHTRAHTAEVLARQGESAAAAAAAAAAESSGRWDHNVITPGTAFMARLAAFLRDFVRRRQHSGGPTWRNLVVVIDDATCPGEG
jgi:5'-3' exonuclease